MAERKNIALFFSYNEGWIGGTYYILSLINALNLIADEKKPTLIIVCNTDDEYEIVKQTNYPYLIQYSIANVQLHFKQTIIERAINKVSNALFNKNILNKKQQLNFPDNVEAIFPCPQMNTFSDVNKSLFWIPDFQEYYFPELFNNNIDEKNWRYNFGKFIATNGLSLVVSSHTVNNDFNIIYPKNNANVVVMPFAVSHPPYEHLNIAALKEKYQINKKYFFSPNQFWKHKNHALVIEAAHLLIQKGIKNFQIVFSGKEADFRNPNYIHELKSKVKEYQLQDYILFLGFIDRKEQLQLMNHALAVIQPSLFEGWSTVIEDAKAMNQNVLASNIDVHKEQILTYGGILFEKENPKSLADCVEACLTITPKKPNYNYVVDKLHFGNKFLEIVSN